MPVPALPALAVLAPRMAAPAFSIGQQLRDLRGRVTEQLDSQPNMPRGYVIVVKRWLVDPSGGLAAGLGRRLLRRRVRIEQRAHIVKLLPNPGVINGDS